METLETPEWVTQFCHRWQKRVFPNDDISCHPSKDSAFPDGCWEVVISRRNWEASLVLDPEVYGNFEYTHSSIHSPLLKADEAMRYSLKAIKEKTLHSKA